MSTENRTKINQLLSSTPKGIILLSYWLKNKGYSLDLQKKYRKTQWLESIGTGAMIRTGDKVDYYGGIYSLQNQANLKIHIAGRTAVALLGKSHYLELSNSKAVLLGSVGEKLPEWFVNYDWHIKIEYHTSSFLPSDLGLSNIQIKEFEIKISGEARSMMECLHFAPEHQELSECYELMENMNNLRPALVQELLEQCSSIKVKRLFLCLAERIKHEWFNYLDLSKIDLGTGKRSIVKKGTWDSKYQITIPVEWVHQ